MLFSSKSGIAVKDGKIFAVEVEYGRPNYAKYDEEMRSRVDDVIWLLRKQETVND